MTAAVSSLLNLRALGGRAESDLGDDRERGEALADLARPGCEFADFADGTRRRRDQLADRQSRLRPGFDAAGPLAAGDAT